MKVFSLFLIALGALTMFLSGLCTLGVFAISRVPRDFGFALIYGGIPFVLGWGFYKWGRHIEKNLNGKQK